MRYLRTIFVKNNILELFLGFLYVVSALRINRGLTMMQGEDMISRLSGLVVYLPSGKKLGVVYDAVIDTSGIRCTHLFVRETDHELVEGGINVAVPWRWVRGVNDVVMLRWFPPTPIPMNS